MYKNFLPVLVIIFFCCCSLYSQPTVYSQFSNGNLDWNDNSIWNDQSDGSGIFSNASGNNLIIQNGDTITINSDLTVNSIIVESGLVIFDSTDRDIVIQDSIFIESPGKFRVHTNGTAYHQITIGGNIFCDGEFNMYPAGTRACKIFFIKDGNQMIYGSGSFTLGPIELNMGNSKENILEITAPVLFRGDEVDLLNGTIKLSNTAEILPFSGTTTLLSTTGIILNHPAAKVLRGRSGTLTMYGIIEINSGTFEYGSIAGNELLVEDSASLIIKGGVLDISGRLKVSGGNMEIENGEINILTQGPANNNSEVFYITAGGKITMSGGTIKINHGNNINNDLKITTGISNINFTGGTFIIGKGDSTENDISIQWKGNMPNLIIDAGNSLISLADDLYISGDLNLTSGLFSLDNYNLVLSDTSSITGSPSASNMIITPGTGKLFKEINAPSSFLFPLGDNNGTAEYSPAVLEFLNGDFTNALVGVSVSNSKHDSVYLVADDYLNRYWNIESTGINNFQCNLILNYTDADIIGNENNIYLGQHNNQSWTILTKAETNNNILQDTVASFSVFTGASQDGMPVELINFNASSSGQNVILNWSTATEINNYRFYIQRKGNSSNQKKSQEKSEDFEWAEIGFVDGSGNSNSTKNYTFSDKIILPGEYFYRLKQVDFNGSFEFSDEIRIIINTPDEFTLYQNYPNPFNPSTTINFNIPEESFVTLTIFNLLGEKILTLINEQKDAGFYSINFNASNLPDRRQSLESGLYFYQLLAGDYSYTKKMLLIK